MVGLPPADLRDSQLTATQQIIAIKLLVPESPDPGEMLDPPKDVI